MTDQMTKQQRAELIYPLMLALDLKTHVLYWVSDEELKKLAKEYL
jgi:hypothetical protein